MRRLLIDGQLFHTPAWHRGMGKYSFELLRALLQENEATKQWGTIEILLSSQYEQEPAMLAALSSLKGCTVHQLPFEKNRSADPLTVLDQNRQIIDEYIASLPEAPSEIDYVMLSLMQSEISPAFPTDSRIHKGLLYYDLIPLMFHETYLASPVVQKEYLSKITELVRADIYFGISKTVANDISLYLGVHPSRVVSIDGGGVAHSQTTKKLTIGKPFILMPTGNDLRKNNRRGIIAFKEFNERHHNDYALVITSSFHEDEQAELQKLAPDVIFTGNISGEELNYLYEKAEALLFPSEYEGLGMPILEAMTKGKPVACSDIAVFREITKTAVSYFNPLRVSEMSEAIERAITSQPDLKEYKRVLNKYNWQRTAKLFAATIAEPTTVTSKAANTKVYVVTPNPQTNSLGKVAQLAHAELSRTITPEYYIAEPKDSSLQRPNLLVQTGPAHNVLSQLQTAPNQIPIIYYIDGSDSSAHILLAALTKPGIVVLGSTQTAAAWDRLEQEKLITEGRLKLEQLIGRTIGIEGLATTLVSRQQAVIAFDEATAISLQKIIKNTNSATQVYQLKAPTNDIKYKDILPEKTESVSGQAVITKSDMEYENLLSRASTVSSKGLDADQASVLKAEAAKYQADVDQTYSYQDYAQDIVKIMNKIYKQGTA